jgi:hypothetical protein
MPTKIVGRAKAPKRRGRGLGFDRRVAALAPAIKALRSEGVLAIHEIMKRLNDAGVAAPNSRRFSFGTTHRVVRRLKQLGLGEGPRSVSDALKQRPNSPRSPRQRPSDVSLTKLQRACEAGLAKQNEGNSP